MQQGPCSGRLPGRRVAVRRRGAAAPADPAVALAVRNNSLSGALPPLADATSPRLRHLLVARNQLTGGLNVSRGALLTLRAERNGFSGGLGALRVPTVRSFNVSGNKLAGEISGELARFPSSAFGGNLALCGRPLPRCVRAYSALGDTASGNSNVTVAAQSPNSAEPNGSFSKLSMTALMATGIGNAVLITVSLTISVAMFVYMKRKLRSAKAPSLFFDEEVSDGNKRRTTTTTNRDGDGTKCPAAKSSGGLVCFEGGEALRLESLLKASAEVLGKGASGSTYKAVLEDGAVAVAVKRLSALRFPAGSGRGKAFDRHMRVVGRVRHRNVLGLRAYCNSNGERLLVYDFLPGGSLQAALQAHGGDVRSLDWAARKSVLLGAAEGLNYIHTFPARPALVHGNVKPSNILLDERGAACVSECGVMRYATNVQHSILPQAAFLDLSASASSSGGGWHGYAAPELASTTRAMQESDVYGFGMVLLEVVTTVVARPGDGCEEEEEDDETMGGQDRDAVHC
ncbi:hypothetical protein PR202_gb21364 [Eleusine coracana subsp. coracana]|uniref:Protein kinase domain-containing protein n=1 Tax=Eleusine coracana subsp. coracana TaxID=191504 RepID=A0AAV5FAY7_ELECO|nr:hypothetical protein PR202_gb21364 [Eleusine coracana subsp. coracana]